MIDLNYDLDVCCKHCNMINKVKTTKDDFSSTTEEKSIGYETEHQHKRKIKCSSCGKDIVFGILIYEYPSDIINYSELTGFGYYKEELNKQFGVMCDEKNNQNNPIPMKWFFIKIGSTTDTNTYLNKLTEKGITPDRIKLTSTSSGFYFDYRIFYFNTEEIKE